MKNFILTVGMGLLVAATVGKAVATQAIEVAQSVPFEALSYCDQLDAIARDGKNVAEYMVGSADPAGYIWAARTECSWHSEQAGIADRIINPPAVRSPIHNPDADLSLCDRNVGSAWWHDHCTAAGQGESGDITQSRQWQRENVDIIPDDTIDPGFSSRFYNDCDGVREPGETPSGGRC